MNGHLRHRLQRGRFQLALPDRLDRVIAAVESDHDDVVPPRGQQRRLGAQCHGVIAADYPLDIGVALQDGLHDAKGFRLAPVRRLLGHHLHVGVFVDHIVVALRADVGVGVGVAAGQLHILALAVHQLHEVLGQDGRTLVVVGDDLCSGDALLCDLPIHQEAGDASVLGLLHGRHGRVRACVV